MSTSFIVDGEFVRGFVCSSIVVPHVRIPDGAICLRAEDDDDDDDSGYCLMYTYTARCPKTLDSAHSDDDSNEPEIDHYRHVEQSIGDFVANGEYPPDGISRECFGWYDRKNVVWRRSSVKLVRETRRSYTSVRSSFPFPS
jgi:hypothetical protein